MQGEVGRSNLLRNLPVKKICQSVKICQNYGHESVTMWPRFIGATLYVTMVTCHHHF